MSADRSVIRDDGEASRLDSDGKDSKDSQDSQSL